MKMNRSSKYIIIALLIVINLILRYPVTPHEIGWDSFDIHISANSISSFGYSKWFLDPSCVFGFHPYSYASSVPFLLSGISQITAIDMEWSIWLFSTMIGVLSVFTAYLMASAIENDDFFKIIVSAIYSTSNGMLYFTTWTVSTRGLFIVLLPLFIYILLKSQSSAKYIILLFTMFLLLATTHHLFYFLFIPIIAYLIVQLFFKFTTFKIYYKYNKQIPNLIKSLILIFCLIVMFMLPFLTRTFINVGSRYRWLELQFLEYAVNIGLLTVFMFGAITYLLSKQKKSFGEWFLIITFIGITPFFYVQKYTKWFFLSIASLFIGISLKNMVKSIHNKKKCASLAIIIVLIFSISFGSYIQFLHNLNDSGAYVRYMEEETYIGALWIKDNIDEPSFSNFILTSKRIFSISEVPMLTGASYNDLAYGFVNPEKLNITVKKSYLSPDFYFHDPYIDNNPPSSWYLSSILQTSFNEGNSYAQRWVERFNFSYFIENQDFSDVFSRSVSDTEEKIYDSGKIKLWRLSDK